MSEASRTGSAAEGVATMDREHALELGIVRALQKALRDGDLVAAGELIERLDAVTEAHFLAEQLLMRQHAYPAYEAHQQEHDRLIGELRELRARIDAGSLAAPAVEAEALERWLVAHMASEDHALAGFLESSAR